MQRSDRAPSRDWVYWTLLVFGAVSVLNGLWMLATPEHWYHELPAGVPDFGPHNDHFVRDIGCAFLTMGAALIGAVRWPWWRTPLTATAALFFALHAGLHVYDTLRGAVDWHHLLLDLPGVYAPAFVLAALTLRFVRNPDFAPGAPMEKKT